MKLVSILAATLMLFAGEDAAAVVYESYDAFYAKQPDAIFRDPIREDAHTAYAFPDKPGLHIELRSKLEGRAVIVEVAEHGLTVNGKVYRFARATTFPGEHASKIIPTSAEVFLAERTAHRPGLLCMEGNGSGSGEAGRHTQIYLLIDPMRSRGQVTFLHLPSLLSSCRAVASTKRGGISFPKNSYLFDDAQERRIGLQMTYYSFERERFARTGKMINLAFIQPEAPFQFSPQDDR